MRKSLVSAVVVVMLTTVMTAVPALARERTWDVDTKRIDWGTVTAPESGATSDGIIITNVSGEPVYLDLSITITKPKDWAEPFSPFIVEDQWLNGEPDPCRDAPLAPGDFCEVFLTFQTDRAGTFTGTLWINDTYQVKLTALAT